MGPEANVQLVFKIDSIMVNANLFKGVLATKTFDGPDCYAELVDFLKQSFGKDLAINATITVR